MVARVAILGASHWHVPLYLPGLDMAGARIVGVWDRDGEAAQRFADRVGADVARDPADLADPNRLDMAFVLGRPVDMPAVATPFIDRAIPVSMEKPGGLAHADVAALEGLAKARGAHVSVAFVQRHAGPGAHLLRTITPSVISSITARFIAGPPRRYRDAGCAWMLDPRLSGGGALANLGIHFVDLAMALCGGALERIHCEVSNKRYGEAVEDHASLVMRFATGAVATVEAGYGFPQGAAKRDFRLTVIGTDGYADFGGDRLVVTDSGGACHVADVEGDTDTYYRAYVLDAIEAVRTGNPPRAGLAELSAALRVVEEAYVRARGSG